MDVEKIDRIIAGISMNGNCTLSNLTPEELTIVGAALRARFPKDEKADAKVPDGTA